MNEREAFERVTEGYYEGEFSKYADGEYVNPQQQDDFTMFKSGWQACEAQHKQKVRELASDVHRLHSGLPDDCTFTEGYLEKVLELINKHFGE